MPTKNAMRSIAQPKSWVLDFEQASPKTVEPLMGWTSSSDVRQQVRMRFDSKEEAIAYCEQNGLPYRLSRVRVQSAKARGAGLRGQLCLYAARSVDTFSTRPMHA